MSFLASSLSAEEYSRIAELVLNIRSTEIRLFKEWGIRMDGQAGEPSRAQDEAYQALMRKIELEARSRRYDPRDASESYSVVLAKQGANHFHLSEASKTISLSNSEDAVGELFAYLERLPLSRTLSRPALLERISAFIQGGESLRLEVQPAEGRPTVDLRIEARGAERWTIVP